MVLPHHTEKFEIRKNRHPTAVAPTTAFPGPAFLRKIPLSATPVIRPYVTHIPE